MRLFESGAWARSLPAVIAVALASVAVRPAVAAHSVHYRVIQTVKLGGDEGWDYLTFDKEGRRVFITRDSHVMVVDADSGMLVGDIRGLGHTHGVALAGPRGYVTDSGTNSVVVFSRATLRKIAEIPAGMRPDGIVYDPFSGRVFAFDGGSHEATAIDVASGRVVGTVPLGGRPEFPATDARGTIYVNIEDKSEIAAFDSKTLTIKRRWSLAPCTEPSGLAIDAKHERVFSGCRNSLMAVSDGRAGKVVATVPIGQGVDANRFDPGYQLAFSSNGFSGSLTVAREVTPNDYRVIENVPTMRSARTMALDPETHRVYVVGAQLERVAHPKPHERPFSIVPGTFELLILGPAD
jgi:YVTN family beta-propeller protein